MAPELSKLVDFVDKFRLLYNITIGEEMNVSFATYVTF